MGAVSGVWIGPTSPALAPVPGGPPLDSTGVGRIGPIGPIGPIKVQVASLREAAVADEPRALPDVQIHGATRGERARTGLRKDRDAPRPPTKRRSSAADPPAAPTRSPSEARPTGGSLGYPPATGCGAMPASPPWSLTGRPVAAHGRSGPSNGSARIGGS